MFINKDYVNFVRFVCCMELFSLFDFKHHTLRLVNVNGVKNEYK